VHQDDTPRIEWWSAEFSNRALEAEFRAASLAFETRWTVHAIWIGIAILVAFVPVDFVTMGATLPFFVALLIRCSMIFGLWSAGRWLARNATPVRLDLAVVLGEAVLVGGFLAILPVRGEGFSLAALTALAVLLAILLLAPGRFLYTVALALTASVAFLAEDRWLQHPPLHELLHVVLVFVVLQAYGIYILHSLNLNRRREFLQKRDLHEANRRLAEEGRQRLATHRLLEESEANFRALFQGAPVPLILSDFNDGRVLEVNQGFLDLAGQSRDEVLGKSTLDCYADAEERALLIQAVERSGGRLNGYELRLRTADGRILTVLASVFGTTHLGAPALMTSLTDISERKAAEQELRMQATTDPLTGLVNRRGFLEGAAREVGRWQRHHPPLSLVLFDIDLFKEANDRGGHLAGDRILQGVAEICRSALRENDLCGRLGGDEFVLLLPDTDAQAAALLAERLRGEVAAATLDAEGGAVTISLGVAQFREKDDLDDVLVRADAFLYEAKKRGRNRVEVA